MMLPSVVALEVSEWGICLRFAGGFVFALGVPLPVVPQEFEVRP